MFLKKKKQWKIKIQLILFAPFKEEYFYIYKNTKIQGYFLFKQFKKKIGSNGIVKIIDWEKVLN